MVAVVLLTGLATPGPAGAATIAAAPGGVRITDITPVGPARPDSDPQVAAVLTDLNAFYAQALPQAFHRAMTPLPGGYQAADSSAAALTAPGLCVDRPADIVGNAYYCPTGDGIVYDSAALVPVLLGSYGPAGLIGAFAHEFGHAVQARIGPTPAQRSAQPTVYPSLLIEAQGDCFAGAFLSWVVAGHAPHLQVGRADLVAAVAPLLDFADPTTVAPADPAAHGLAVDRLAHVLVGYRTGVLGCHQLTRADLHPTLGMAGVAQPSAPRYRDETAALAAARAALARVAADLPAPTRWSAAVSPLPADLAAGRPYGQFAVAASLVLAAGRAATGSPTGAACALGVWTRLLFGHAAAGTLGGWAGDADEALNMLRARPDATFDELTAFSAGFAAGRSGC